MLIHKYDLQEWEIWCFHGGKNNDDLLLGFGTMYTHWQMPMFQRNILRPGIQPDDTDIMLLRNTGIYQQIYMVPKPKRSTSSSLKGAQEHFK
jgi:hypothetical protein